MNVISFLASCLLLAPPAPAAAQDTDLARLFPAGSINSVFAHAELLILAEDEPAIVRHANWVRESFFPDRARVLVGSETVAEDLSGYNLIVFGTMEGHPWLAENRARLPFAFTEQGVELEGTFTGEQLRVICAVRNPQDLERRAVIYSAVRAEDLKNVNNVFHGPTEYVVANGDTVLKAGSFSVAEHLTPEQMSVDLELLVDKLLSCHPATVEGALPELEAAVLAARQEITRPLKRTEFWFVANGITLTLRDAHTSMHPLASGMLVDLPIEWLADGMVVATDTELLRRGDRILHISGQDEAQLLQKLKGLVPAENDHFIRAQAPSRLRDLDVLRLLGIADQAPVLVRVERDGEVLDLEVPLGRTPVAQSASSDWVRWAIDEESDLAVFVLDRCEVSAHYTQQLKAFFSDVMERGIGRVAVDLRANGGGNSKVCDEFLRFVDVPEYASYTGAVRESLDSLSQRNGNGEIGFTRYGPRRIANPPMPGFERFRGKLYALTSKRTFSSGSWFAVVLRDNALATIVGEPTGGAPSSYGDTLTFTLPESSLTFSVSFKSWLRPAAERDPATTLERDPATTLERDPATTLEPDELVPLTREQLIDGYDPVIEFLKAYAD